MEGRFHDEEARSSANNNLRFFESKRVGRFHYEEVHFQFRQIELFSSLQTHLRMKNNRIYILRSLRKNDFV